MGAAPNENISWQDRPARESSRIVSTRRFEVTACTGIHIGDRVEQQDSVGVFRAKRRANCALFVVADGMGGKTGGKMASEQVMVTAKNLFEDFSADDAAEEFLARLVQETHTIIRLNALSSEKEPHSTIVALLVLEDSAEWVHVGDSRLYYFRKADLIERTIDHSFVEQLVFEGKLDPRKAQSHPKSHLLTNALGTLKPPYATLGKIATPQPGDNFLLCSDGLWHYFNDVELGILVSATEPRTASERIMQLTRSRSLGGGDNCSMIIVRLDEPGA